jgi:hypothetical protein
LASFRLEAKMMTVFRFFFVLFSLRSIFVSLQISTFRIDAKQAKKALFSHRSEKKIRFRFASFRFEAKMTAHPRYRCSFTSQILARSSNLVSRSLYLVTCVLYRS